MIRIMGNSFNIKEKLKSLGFKWNQEMKTWEITRRNLEEHDFSAIVTGPVQSLEQTQNQILEEIDSIQTPLFHQLLDKLLITGPYKDSFFTAPGAKGIHHAYIGGLAEHTLHVLLGSKAMADVYNFLKINRDLLMTGAILHDIGKIDCYSVNSDGISTTKKMDLFDHIVLGISIVSRIAQELVQSPEDEELLGQLIHILASHHALPEWGSPKEPQTIEAWIIHVNDLLSARIANEKRVISK